MFIKKVHQQSALKTFKTEKDVHYTQTSSWVFTENTLCCN
jgi:hypothetical protein